MGRATAIRQEAEELDYEEWNKALEPAVELEKEAAELIRQELVPIVQDVLSNQLGDHGGVSFSDVFDGREWSMGETLSEHVVSTVYHVGGTMWYMLGPEVNALRDFEKRLQELASLLITTWADRSGLDAHSVMDRDISGLTKAGRQKLLEHFAGVAQNIEDAVVPRLLQLTSEVKDIEPAPEEVLIESPAVPETPGETEIISRLRRVHDRMDYLEGLDDPRPFEEGDPRRSEWERLARWSLIYQDKVAKADQRAEMLDAGDGTEAVDESQMEPPKEEVTAAVVLNAFDFENAGMITTGLGLDVNDHGYGTFEEFGDNIVTVYVSPPLEEQVVNEIMLDIGGRWGEAIKVVDVIDAGMAGQKVIRLADGQSWKLWEDNPLDETPDVFGLPSDEAGRVTTRPIKGGRGGKSQSAYKVIKALMLLTRKFGYKGVTGAMPLVVGVKSKENLGEFYPREQLMKIRDAHDLGAAAHEFGHAVQVLHFRQTEKSPITKDLVGKKSYEELMSAGEKLYPKIEGKDSVPKGGYAQEGFAEFIYTYLDKPEELNESFPNTLDWFNKEVLTKHKGAQKAMLKVRGMYERYKAQGSLTLAKEHIIDTGSARERWDQFVHAMRHGPSQAIHNWWETLSPVAMIDNQAELETGEPVKFKDSAYQKIMSYRGTHSGIVNYWVNTGVKDIGGNDTGIRPLRDVADHVLPEHHKEFMAYLWAKRAKALLTQTDKEGKPAPRAAGLTLAQAQEIIEAVEELRGTSKMQKAAQIVYDWNAGVLDYAAGASPLYEELARRIREVDPGFYIPLERQFREFDQRLAEMSDAPTMDGRGVLKRLKGSARLEIKDPFQTMIVNAESMVLASHGRVALETMMRMSQTVPGMGNLIFKEHRTSVPKTQRTIQDLVTRVEKEAEDQNIDLSMTDEYGRPFEQIAGNLASQVITFYGAAVAPEKGAPILPFIEAGEPDEQTGERKLRVAWYRVNEKIFRALASMNPKQHRYLQQSLILRGVYNYGGRGFNRLFKMGTVGFRASFGLVTNPIRDLATLWVNSQSNANGAVLLWTFAGSVIQELVSALSGGRIKSEMSELWQGLGGENAMFLMEQRSFLRRSARMVTQSKNIGRRIITYAPWRVAKNPVRTVKAAKDDLITVVDFLQDLIQFPERATRVTEMKLVAKDISKDPSIDWKVGDPMTAEVAQELLLAGKQVSVDFTASGELAAVYNQIVPFFNANLQGARAWGRAMTRDRRTGGLLGWKSAKIAGVNLFPMFRGMQLFSMSLFLWWKYKDEEWWQKMDPREKFMFWHFPATINGEEVLVRLPMSYDSGMFFAGTAIALADAAYRQDPEEITRFMMAFTEANTPIELPVMKNAHGYTWGPTNAAGVLGKVASELMLNRKSFWDTPVVSPRFLRGPQGESVPRGQMYNEYTSKAARIIGEKYNLPPQQIDHALQSIVGPIARDILHTGEHLDELFRLKKYQTVSDVPVLGRVFRRGGPLGSRPEPIDRLFDEFARSVVKSNDGAVKESGMELDKRMKLADATRGVALIFHIRTFEKSDRVRRDLTREAMELSEEVLSDLEIGWTGRDEVRLKVDRLQERANQADYQRHIGAGDFEKAAEASAKIEKSDLIKLKKLMPAKKGRKKGPAKWDRKRETLEDFQKRVNEYLFQMEKAAQ